jgi:hypothetical protein
MPDHGWLRSTWPAFAINQSIANSRGPVVSRSRAANAASELRELMPAGRTVRTTRPTNDLVSLSAVSASLVGRKGMLKATAVRGVESSRCGDRNRARRSAWERRKRRAKIVATPHGRSYAASVASSVGSRIEGSSFSGLLTRVEIGHIRIRSAGKGRIRSRGSGSSPSQRA